MKDELYFSVDIEANGPIPGAYSMVSFGMSASVLRQGDEYQDLNVEYPRHTFYAELKPLHDTYIPEALAVSGLEHETLKEQGREPAEAMTAAVAWVRDLSASYNAKAVFCAYPLAFDWMFWYWYAVSFSETGSPFGHSSHLDMKTLYAARSNEPIGRSVKGRMPKHLLSNRKHTHHALDDAIEQGEMLGNLLRWDGQRNAGR